MKIVSIQAVALIVVAASAAGFAVGCEMGVTPANKGDATATTLPPPAPERRDAPVASDEQFLVHYSVKFSGGMALSGTFDKAISRSEYRNCLDYISNVDDRNFGVEGAEVAGHQFGVSVEHVYIHGPGNYAPEPGGSVGVQFDSSDERYNFSNEASVGSTRITVNADGSGSLTFSGWQNSSGEQESGAVSWTCR